MTGPSPRDTRLFDAGARWATEPTDRRGYGDALRDAVERAGAGVRGAEESACVKTNDGHLCFTTARADLRYLIQEASALHDTATDERLAQAHDVIEHAMVTIRDLSIPRDEDVDQAEVRRVMADRGYRGDDEPVAVLLARVLDGLGARRTDRYGTGDGSYPEPSVDAADEAGPDVTGYIGAVRRGPQGHGVVRIDNAGADDWLMIGGARTASGEPLGGRYADRDVEHWPVAGVVPGTPAAWMSGEPIPDRDSEDGEGS